MKQFVFLSFMVALSGCGPTLSREEADSIAMVRWYDSATRANTAAIQQLQDSLAKVPEQESIFSWLGKHPFVMDEYKDRFTQKPLGKKLEISRDSYDTAGMVRMAREDYCIIFRKESDENYHKDAQYFFCSIENLPGKEYYSVTALRFFTLDRADLVLVNISRDGLKADHVDAASYFYEGSGFESAMSKSVSTVSASGRVVLNDNYFMPNYDYARYDDFSKTNRLGEITHYRFVLEPAADGTFDQVEMHSWKRKVISTDDIDDKLFY